MMIRSTILGGTRALVVAPLKTLTAPAAARQPVIVIHRGSNRLYLYSGVRLVRTFPVATGQPIYPTPLGHFQIVVKQLNPGGIRRPRTPGRRGSSPFRPAPATRSEPAGWD